MRSRRTASSNVLACCGVNGRISSPELRRLDGFCRVARDESVLHGLLEGFVQRDMDVLHRAGRKPCLELRLVETAHMGRGQVLELYAADLGNNMLAGYLFVPLERGAPYGIFHGVGKATVQVVLYLDGPGIEHEAAVRVRHGLTERPFRVTLVLCGDVTPLPIGGEGDPR